MRPAIVISTYNRDNSLNRLLGSLARADYPGELEIPLIISIDKSSNENVAKVADDFKWPFGPKEIIEHEENLGLRRHILFCGDLSERFGSIILLEDDLYVSPYFYNYTLKSLDFFSNEPSVAGISLFNHVFNETAKRSFIPIEDGFDNYFIQLPSSWGQVWTAMQWKYFKNWYEKFSKEKVTFEDRIPNDVANWPESSWKKYFIKYMVVNDLYFSFPRISLSTNFMDPGTHHKGKLHTLQVCLQNVKREYNFSLPEESNAIYDCFCELSPSILKKLNKELKTYDFEVDMYGAKDPAIFMREYFLTSKVCQEPLQTWGLALKPHEQNIICNNVEGNFFKLAKRENCKEREELGINQLLNYYFAVPVNHISWHNQVQWGTDQVTAKQAFDILVSKITNKVKRISKYFFSLIPTMPLDK